MSDPPKRTHFRGKRRLDRSLSLRFRERDASETSAVEASTDNIGVGGAFIGHHAPWPIGTELMLSLDIPGHADPVPLAAQVKWIVPQGHAHESPGMGVAFLDPAFETVAALKAYFASLTGEDG